MGCPKSNDKLFEIKNQALSEENVSDKIIEIERRKEMGRKRK